MRNLLTSGVAIALIGLFQQAGPAFADTPVGGWSDAGKLSTERPGNSLAILLTDGRVLVTGVSSGDYSGLGNVDIYDPARGWSLGPQLPSDWRGAVAAPLPNGDALLAGGVPYRGGSGGPGPDPVATAATYSAASNAWTAAPNMSVPRSGATAALLADGRVLVAGGYDRRVTQLPNPDGQPFCCIDVQFLPQATSELFDARSRTWSSGPPLLHGRSGQSGVTLKAGQVLIVGGSDQQHQQFPQQLLDSTELFDPSQGRWLSAGSIGTARSGFTLTALVDGRALLTGGSTADGSAVSPSTLLYDPRTNVWSPGPDMPEARSDSSAAALKDGRVLVTGGTDQLGRMASSVILNPSIGSWTAAGALATARSGHASITLQDGRILAVGGFGSLGSLATSEQFDSMTHGVPAPARSEAGPGKWRTRSAQPFTTYQQTARVLVDGRVLLLPVGPYSDFQAQLFDPKTDAWSTPINRKGNRTFFATGVALDDGRVLLLTSDWQGSAPAKSEIIDLPSGATKPAASPGIMSSSARLDLLHDGRVWLTGSMNSGGNALIYDPKADSWTSAPNVPNGLYIGTLTNLLDGRVLVGGIVRAMIFDPARSTWNALDPFPTRWQSYSATRLPSGDVLLAGGTEEQSLPDSRRVDVASTRVMLWNHAAGLLTRAKDSTNLHPVDAAAVLADGRVLFAGGMSGNPQSDPSWTAAIYDTTRDSWSTAASMPVARSQATAVLMKDGHVLMFGGYGMLNPAPTLEYTPGSNPAVTTRPVFSTPSNAGPALGALGIVAAIGLAIWLVASVRRKRSS